MRKEHIQFTFGAQNESVTASGSGSNHINILIVEDNLIARISLKNLLLKLDEQADLAFTGEEAIEKIKIIPHE